MRILLITQFFSLYVYLGFQNPSVAQETNYWTNQIGASSALLGGAVTAGIRDNSAIFYNPGALGNIESSTISGNGDAYYIRWINIKNGAGANLDLRGNRLNSVPLFFSGVVKSKKNPNFSVNYATLNNQILDYRLFASNEMDYDVIESRPGLERYVGTYSYRNRTRDDWFGVGMGHLVGKSKKIGIGGSMFFSAMSQEFSEQFNATVSERDNGINNMIAFAKTENSFTYSSIGVIFKAGIAFDFDQWKFGFTIAPPILNLNFVGKGSLLRSTSLFIPSQFPSSPTYSLIRQKQETRRRTPWIFDVGASFEWGDNNTIGIRSTLYSKVAPYNLLQEYSGDVPQDSILNLSGFDNMRTAHKRTINFGVGFAHRLAQGFSLLTGFHSDFNFYDEESLPRETNFVNSIGYWNLWHFSGGVIWFWERYKINVGGIWANGRSSGDIQQINLTDPKDFRFLQGERDFSTETQTGHFMIVLGFAFQFSDN